MILRHCERQRARLLIQNGAEIQVKDKNGDTPIDLAKGKKKTRVVEFLEAQVWVQLIGLM